MFSPFPWNSRYRSSPVVTKEMNRRQKINKFRRFNAVFMSSIIDFTCQSKNRNVESQWKFQGQSTLQMRIMLKNSSHKVLTPTLIYHIKAANAILLLRKHYCQHNLLFFYTFLTGILEMGQFESLSWRMNIVYMKTSK